MAERKFEYENVGSDYQKMLSLIGSAGEADTIAGILDKLNQEMKARVNVEEEAIFGDLGSQLLLNWDNSSSNFPGFVTKFNNWATLIAQSAGNYTQFENDVAGFKAANPLGATSGGITDNYVNTSYYNQYQAANYENYLNSLNSMGSYNQITGVTYTTTDSESILKKHKLITTAVGIADVAGILWTGMAAFGVLGGTTATAGGGTGPALPSPTDSGLPKLPGNTSTTPLLPGSGRGLGINEFADRLALINPGSTETGALLNVTNQAQAAGAEFVSFDSNVPNIIQYFNNLGKLIAEFNGSTGAFTVF